MKVLQISPRYDPAGGAAVYVRQIVRKLRENGHEVVIGTLKALPDDTGVVLLPWMENIGKSFTTIRSLRKFITRWSPDVIHIHDTNNVFLAFWLTRIAPVVRTFHAYSNTCPKNDRLLDENKICTQRAGVACIWRGCVKISSTKMLSRIILRGIIEPWVQRFYHRTIVASDFVKNIYFNCGFNEKFITKLSCATILQSEDRKLKCEYGRILFVGRLVKEKGVLHLLEALRDVNENYQLIIVGDGPFRKRIDEYISNYKMGNNVKIKGWLTSDNLVHEYQKCQFVVVPSLWAEPFGMIGIEAMSHGRPVIAYNIGGISEWLNHGRTGILVSAANVKGLSASIIQMLREPIVCHKMGEEARKWVNKNHKIDKHIKHLLEIYKAARKSY